MEESAVSEDAHAQPRTHTHSQARTRPTHRTGIALQSKLAITRKNNNINKDTIIIIIMTIY